jgi:NADH:ubiquinone oxidoreductase subunit E
MVKVTEAPEKPQFKAETMQEVQRIIAQYPEGKQKSALLTRTAFGSRRVRWMA